MQVSLRWLATVTLLVELWSSNSEFALASSCLECNVPDQLQLRFCSGIEYNVCRGNSNWSQMDQHAQEAFEALNVTQSNTTSSICISDLKKMSCAKAFPVCELGSPILFCQKSCQQVNCSALATEKLQDVCQPTSGDAMQGITTGSKCFDFTYAGPNQLAWVIGFGISVVFSFLASVGINLQKKALKGNEMVAKELNRKPVPVYKLPLWVLGFFLILLGSILDFVAFGLAPQSLLAPLGALTLVWNMMLAPCFNKEKLSRSDIVATMVIFVGATLAVIFGSHSTPEYNIDDLRNLYYDPITIRYFVSLPFIIGLHYGLIVLVERHNLADPDNRTNKISPTIWARLHLVGYSGLAGTMGGQSVLFAKSTAELVKSAIQGEASFKHWETYLIVTLLIGCLLVQIHYLNGALLRFDALSVVPVYQAYWIVMGVLGGVIYFQEIQHFSTVQQFFFVLGISVTIIGVVLLTRRKMNANVTVGLPEEQVKPTFKKVATTSKGEGVVLSPEGKAEGLEAEEAQERAIDNFLDMSPRIGIGEIFEGLGVPKTQQPEIFRRSSSRRDSGIDRPSPVSADENKDKEIIGDPAKDRLCLLQESRSYADSRTMSGSMRPLSTSAAIGSPLRRKNSTKTRAASFDSEDFASM